MNLDEAQRQKVAAWIAEGLKLGEIQNRLASELGLRLTYMDVRLLVDDLNLTPKDPEPAKPAEPPVGPTTPPHAPAAKDTKPAPADSSKRSGVSVTVDQIAQPGTIVSGKVTFSDGQQGSWFLDQTGRLGVAPKQQGYKPSPADVQQFQLALDKEMAKLGF